MVFNNFIYLMNSHCNYNDCSTWEMRKLYDFNYIRKYMMRSFKKNEIDRLYLDLDNQKMSDDSIRQFFNEEIDEILEWIINHFNSLIINVLMKSLKRG